ncbi:unnamed protein product [Candidula unifasciata]|uniref:Copper transport protein n=1 Tax=Candidula unifasciata TaxID=100452 RepID=A0A8S3YQH1_9EUPU|nr:unnamed protein product [Candidula unifasciata]
MDHNHDHSTMDHSHDHATMDHSNHVMQTTTGSNHDHGSGGHDHGSGGHGSMDMMYMKMYFHDGYSEYILFESCLTKSPGGMVGACFIVFFLAVLYEGLKFLREIVLQRSLAGKAHTVYTVDTLPAGSSQEQMVMQIRNPSVTSRMLTSSHFLQTLLHVIQVFISYCLMLVFMTYNVWLCVAIILGAGAGYFTFGWKRAMVVDSNEHCH